MHFSLVVSDDRHFWHQKYFLSLFSFHICFRCPWNMYYEIAEQCSERELVLSSWFCMYLFFDHQIAPHVTSFHGHCHFDGTNNSLLNYHIYITWTYCDSRLQCSGCVDHCGLFQCRASIPQRSTTKDNSISNRIDGFKVLH